jgi:hypothetical protein
VAWVASRKDVLSVFWELLAFIFWVKAVITEEVKEVSHGDAETRSGGRGCAEPPRAETHAECSALRSPSSDLRSLISDHKPQLFRTFALLCFVCACLCKPTAMTFPILAGLLEFLLTRRVLWNHYLVPFLGALVVAGITQYSQVTGGATFTLSNVPFYGRLLNAAAAFGLYCWQTFFPSHLAAVYVHKWPDMPLFLIPGLFVCMIYGVGLSILFWRSGACRLLFDELPASVHRVVRVSALTSDLRPPISGLARGVFAGLAWFLFAIVPMLGLLCFGLHSHADRFTYLPAVGFSLALAIAWAHLGSKAVRLLGIVLVVVLAAFFGLTWRQAGFWKNDGTLFRHALEVDPVRNDVAHRNLGRYYYDVEHNLPLAIQHWDQMFKISRERNRNVQLYYFSPLPKAVILSVRKKKHGIWNNGKKSVFINK